MSRVEFAFFLWYIYCKKRYKGGYTLRIAVCDDGLDFLAHAKTLLAAWHPQMDTVVTEFFEDGDALIHAHTSAPFDIILLDVVMPLLNGIEAAREIRQHDKSVRIVFLTSSPEFAVDSYTVKASNYLLKPLDAKKLYRCLDELTEELRQNARSITVRGVHVVQRVELARIEYVEAQNKHVLFSLSDGKTILSTEPLYTYESKLLLSDGFFKCSRSYIVNLHRIDTYTPKEIRMRTGCRIPISRSCHKEFESAYFATLFGKAGDL